MIRDGFGAQEEEIRYLLGQLKGRPLAPSPAASSRIKTRMLKESERVHASREPWWQRWGFHIPGVPNIEIWKLTAAAVYATGIVLIILSVLWFGNTAASPALAQLQASKGTVKIERQVELIANLHYTYKKAVPAGGKIVLSPGDKIVVPDGAKGTLYFANGSRTAISGDTELILNSTPGSEKQIALTLKLSKGSIKNYINNNESNFSVQTPIAVATVNGTVFRVGVGDEDHTFLATDEGVVNVRIDGEEVNVKAGQELEVSKGEKLEIEVRPQPPKVCISLPGQKGSCSHTMYSKYRMAEVVARTVPRAKVVVFQGDRVTDFTWADENGVARYPVVARAEGKYTFRLKVTKGKNIYSRFSAPVTFVYDKTPPPLHILAPKSPIVVQSHTKIVGKTEPGARVAINNKFIPVDATGMFTTTITLDHGKTPLDITVIDQAGNEMENHLVLERR